jgi:hypothetical protein
MTNTSYTVILSKNFYDDENSLNDVLNLLKCPHISLHHENKVSAISMFH